MLSLCLLIQHSISVHPLGLCLRVIVNEKPQNLKKTTSSVLSVLLLIYVPAQPLRRTVPGICFRLLNIVRCFMQDILHSCNIQLMKCMTFRNF